MVSETEEYKRLRSLIASVQSMGGDEALKILAPEAESISNEDAFDPFEPEVMPSQTHVPTGFNPNVVVLWQSKDQTRLIWLCSPDGRCEGVEISLWTWRDFIKANMYVVDLLLDEVADTCDLEASSEYQGELDELEAALVSMYTWELEVYKQRIEEALKDEI